MSGFPLVRTRSSSIARNTTSSSDGKLLLTRTYSVPDLSSSYRIADTVYKPYPFPNYYDPFVYYTPSDDYWYDRYKSYRRSIYNGYYPAYNRYLYNDYPYSYWYRCKSRLNNWDYPYHYRSYVNPYYDTYLRNVYLRPYRSYWSSYSFYWPY
uniref:Uncharacterized protein n=2 Tax=Acrobeloides nanus TaxID=290746 RepID=A0A914DN27_9BILA